MHSCLLSMLEWLAQSEPDGPRFTWHLGHHIDEWLPMRYWQVAQQVFTHIDTADTLRGLKVSIALFAEVSGVVAKRHGLSARSDLLDRVRSYIATTLPATHQV